MGHEEFHRADTAEACENQREADESGESEPRQVHEQRKREAEKNEKANDQPNLAIDRGNRFAVHDQERLE
jgi:hypothetical protein